MNATQTATLIIGAYSVVTMIGHAYPTTRVGKLCLAVGADIKAVLAALSKSAP